jgi:GAF domain-containing protein
LSFNQNRETMKAPLPRDEEERLNVLHRYEILDTPPEREFDDITLLASHLCGAPIALISLIDEDRQWFKSKVGFTLEETSRDLSFCAYGILQREVFVVNDPETDPRFASNPLVTANYGIRFYAGAPLITAEGHALGTLCVIDRVRRELSPESLRALQALSRQVVAHLTLRRSLKLQREAKDGTRTNATGPKLEDGLHGGAGELVDRRHSGRGSAREEDSAKSATQRLAEDPAAHRGGSGRS